MRCLLIEDYLPLRDSIRESLVEDGFVVDDCGAGDEGLWSARNHSYQVIILDIMLPVIDGLEVLRTLREIHDATPVILISAKDSVKQRVEGLNAGADDYLIKPFDMEELLARVKALIRRRYDKESPLIEVGDMTIDLVKKEVQRSGRRIELTSLQYRMLEYLAHRRDQVVSRSEIEEHVYYEHDDGASNKVDVYISYIRKRLNAGGARDLIKTRRGYGYVLTAE